ncbi:MAG: response regulator [Candidatus Kariarchaeaceae archaeon]|jgi:CheY-like chemotaxis protein
MQSQKPVGSSPRGKTILIVDDNLSIRNLLRKLLETKGYTVLQAEEGREAIKLFKKMDHDIDLIILDHVMENGIDGFTCFVKLKKIKPNVKAIACSGSLDAILEKKYLSENISGILRKPFSNEKLLKMIDQIL